MNDRSVQKLRYFLESGLDTLEALQARHGMSLWMVSCGDDESVTLQVRGSSLDTEDEGVKNTLKQYCRIAAVTGPKIDPAVDAASLLAGTDTSRRLKVGAFIGYPLRLDDGTLVGTLCAIDPEPQPDALREAGPEIEIVAKLLANILALESRHDILLRQVERAQARVVDADTGLYSESGWSHLVEAEEKRCDRYDRPAGAIVLKIDGCDMRVAGALLADRTRGTDVAARIGDDKLGLLVLETKTNALPKVVERLDRELTARGIAARIGSAMRNPKTGFAASIAAAEPVPAH